MRRRRGEGHPDRDQCPRDALEIRILALLASLICASWRTSACVRRMPSSAIPLANCLHSRQPYEGRSLGIARHASPRWETCTQSVRHPFRRHGDCVSRLTSCCGRPQSGQLILRAVSRSGSESRLFVHATQTLEVEVCIAHDKVSDCHIFQASQSESTGRAAAAHQGPAVVQSARSIYRRRERGCRCRAVRSPVQRPRRRVSAVLGRAAGELFCRRQRLRRVLPCECRELARRPSAHCSWSKAEQGTSAVT